MIQPFTPLPIAAAILAFSSPLAAQDEAGEYNAEVYEAGVNCSALHAFMSAAMAEDGSAAGPEFSESATRFLYIAMMRNEAAAEKDMMQSLDNLIGRVESLGEDEQSIEGLLTGGMQRCEAFRQNIADEYDAVDLTE